MAITVIQTSGGGTGWPINGGTWAMRKPITIQHTQVPGALANFPVLISSTDADFKTTGNGGSMGRSDGKDLFFTDANGVKLNHELELFDGTAGNVVAWVQVPALSPSSDTVIYAYFGNASANDQQTVTGTWDSNYMGVWHLPNGITLTANDSTGANNGSIAGATAVAGKIGGAANIGSNQVISVGTGASIATLQVPMTISGWFYSTTTSGSQTIFSQYSSPSGLLTKMVRLDGGTLVYYMGDGANNTYQSKSYAGSPSINTRHYFSVVVNGSVASPTVNITIDGNTRFVQQPE